MASMRCLIASATAWSFFLSAASRSRWSSFTSWALSLPTWASVAVATAAIAASALSAIFWASGGRAAASSAVMQRTSTQRRAMRAGRMVLMVNSRCGRCAWSPLRAGDPGPARTLSGRVSGTPACSSEIIRTSRMGRHRAHQAHQFAVLYRLFSPMDQWSCHAQTLSTGSGWEAGGGASARGGPPLRGMAPGHDAICYIAGLEREQAPDPGPH